MNKPFVLYDLDRVETRLGRRAGLFRHHLDGIGCTACVNFLVVEKVVRLDVAGRLDRVPVDLAR